MSKDVFNLLPSLEQLDLGFNLISRLNSGCFNGLNSLTTLEINKNWLDFDRMSSELLKNLTSLKVLDLSFNVFNTLTQAKLNGANGLNELNLESSQVVFKDKDAFAQISELKKQNLRLNPVVELFPGLIKEICADPNA